MKQYNITAQAYDLISSNPKQSILVNAIVESQNQESAKILFESDMIKDSIEINRILSIEQVK